MLLCKFDNNLKFTYKLSFNIKKIFLKKSGLILKMGPAGLEPATMSVMSGTFYQLKYRPPFLKRIMPLRKRHFLKITPVFVILKQHFQNVATFDAKYFAYEVFLNLDELT